MIANLGRKRSPADQNAGADQNADRGVEPLGSTFSLVRCRLITGRTHQIRVHLSAKGWPLVGDAAYGRRGVRPSDDASIEAARAFPRQALHAWRLSFRHPVGGAELVLTAPLPDDLRALCSALNLPTL